VTDIKTEGVAAKTAAPAPWKLLLMLVAMNGLAPVSPTSSCLRSDPCEDTRQ
jgi:hypothetical protein